MKKFLDWTTEIDAIFWIVTGTLVVAFLILAILLSRGGRSTETKAVLDAIDATRDQLGKVDERIEQDHRFQANWMRRLLARFGFLDSQDIVKDVKPPKSPKPRDTDGD